jgi:hypothetical protein
MFYHYCSLLPNPCSLLIPRARMSLSLDTEVNPMLTLSVFQYIF